MAGHFYHILLKNPLVAVVNAGPELQSALRYTEKVAKGAKTHLFAKMTWHGPAVLEELATFIFQAAKTHPYVQFTFMTATSEDDVLYRRHGLDSIWCSPNAFLDARIYRPNTNAEKLYDAIYVARLVPFKRHHLAVDIPSIAVVTKNYEVDADTAASALGNYRDLQYVNYDSERGVTELTPVQVQEKIAQSRCGLALSAEEGAMFACCEYLLSGLPIVTTPSRGGRDVFFHSDYVEVVEETPEAVASGVARLIARNLDPEMIRNRTYQLFMEHRARLLFRLSGLAQRDLFKHAGPNLWLPQFVNKFETWVPSSS